MDLLVLHQDELDNLALYLADGNASHLENIKPAPLIEDGLTHVVEGTVVEHDMCDVEFTNRARVA